MFPAIGWNIGFSPFGLTIDKLSQLYQASLVSACLKIMWKNDFSTVGEHKNFVKNSTQDLLCIVEAIQRHDSGSLTRVQN